MSDDQNPEAGAVSADEQELSVFLTQDQDEEASEPDESEEADTGQAEDDAEDDAEEDGDPDESEAEEEDDADDDPLVTITTKQGSRDVRLSELKDGYLRKQDYTRKTMEVADARKTLDRELSQIAETKQQLEAQLAEWAVQAEQEPDWPTLATQMHPQEFQYRRSLWDQHKANTERARAEYQRLVNETKQERMEKERGRLLEAIPDWTDPEVFKRDAEAIVAFGADYGFSQEELSAVDDHRVLRLLREAVELRRLREANASAQKKVAKAATTLQPGHKSTRKETAEKVRKTASDRFRRNPDDKDAFADWILTG